LGWVIGKGDMVDSAEETLRSPREALG